MTDLVKIEVEKSDAVRIFMSLDLAINGLSHHTTTCPDPTDPQYAKGLGELEAEICQLKALKKQVQLALSSEGPRIVLSH